MRIILCGDRHWTNRQIIRKRLLAFPQDVAQVMTGGCRGADRIAEDEALKLGFIVLRMPANWYKGPQAGPERNERMLDFFEPDLVIAFHNNISQSKGTKHMERIAREAGVQTEIIKE